MKRRSFWVGMVVVISVGLGSEVRAGEKIEFCGQEIEPTATDRNETEV